LLPITAYGSADADVITTGNANDRLDGGDGDDTLVGGEGDDALIGGAGDDTLDGQEGCDACDGGEGVDTNLDDQSAAKVEGVEADLGKGRSVCGRTLPPGTLIVDEVSGVAYDFSLIPAGKSVLGARSDDAEAASNERPTHDVTHSRPFLMGRTEVTQAQYQAVVGNNPSLHQGPPLRPVEWVSWYDSVTFCNRLSDAAGRMRAYDESNRWNLSADGYRLPTEAEWEFAARAGTASPRYGPVDDISWNGGNSGGVTHEVATRTPNEWGLHDVLGNVWERVWDDYSTYDAAPTVDPIGSPLPSGDGLLRGGSWCCTIDAVRLSTRYPYGRALLGGNVGFRLARWQE
jgi:formylglycine-generating enzyme required for sulfatase activity